MGRACGVLALTLASCSPVAAPPVAGHDPVPLAGRVVYGCDGGKTLAVSYDPDADPASVVINVDGPETLLQEPVAAGLRYAWPSDGSHHIWELRDGVGTLSYRDGEQGTVTPVMTNCRA